MMFIDRLRYNYFSYLFTEEPFPIDETAEAKPVNRKIKKIEKQLAVGTFDTVERSAEGLNYRPAQREWYSVVAYPNSTNSAIIVDLINYVDLMSALTTFKEACEKNYYTVEMYRHRSVPMVGLPMMDKEQKTLVLKCKYDYITGNDRDFLKFVSGSFDKKWRFQAEDEEVITRSLGQIPDWELRMMYQQGKISKAQMEIGIGLKMEAEFEVEGFPGSVQDEIQIEDWSVQDLMYSNSITGNFLEDQAKFNYGLNAEFEAPAAPKVKFPRAKADKIVAEVEAHMKPMVDKIMACGSYRRGAQMIGDIDFVIIPKEGNTLPNMLPPNQGVNWVGENKAQVIIDGEKVDFKVTTPDAWGATILYFTGPADFNIKYRIMAKKQGKKLNEYGVWDRDTETYLAGKTEQDVYTELGRPYKEPKDRQGWNRKKAAESFAAETYPRCPICFEYIPNNQNPGKYPGALARYDNQTEICSECGTTEAMVGFMATPEILATYQKSEKTFEDYRILILNVKHKMPEVMFGRGPEWDILQKLNKDNKNSEEMNEQVFKKRLGWKAGTIENLDKRKDYTPMAINLSRQNYHVHPKGFELGSLFGSEDLLDEMYDKRGDVYIDPVPFKEKPSSAHSTGGNMDTETPMTINMSYLNYHTPYKMRRMEAEENNKVFGVQRHEAQRAGLHYDLRLERDGVLKSWSIPKGMPTDNRHLAIATDDHNMSWLDFEGETLRKVMVQESIFR